MQNSTPGAIMENQETTKDKLDRLIPLFYVNDKEAKQYIEVSEGYKKEIKQLMLDGSIEEFPCGDLRATCKISTREDFNQDRLLAKIKQLGVQGIIKTVEVVDMDALENALYHGQLNAAELVTCRESKEVVTLRVSKIKKK